MVRVGTGGRSGGTGGDASGSVGDAEEGWATMVVTDEVVVGEDEGGSFGRMGC